MPALRNAKEIWNYTSNASEQEEFQIKWWHGNSSVLMMNRFHKNSPHT